MKNLITLLVPANSILLLLLAFAVSFCLYLPLKAQPTLTYTQIIQGMSSPLDIKNAGDGTQRLFIVEQTGAVKIYKNGSLLAKPFLNLSAITSHDANERGLLSIAFHPKYKTNRTFFVYYTDLSGAVTLARYKTSSNADSAIANSGKILLSLPKPGGYSNHNGGNLHFGKDGYLYLTIGDGGSGGDPFGNGQNGLVLFGKMLRLDVNANTTTAPYYGIPADNPFVGNAAYRGEVYALGLRNTWRWSFDRQTGDVWLGDVGQDKWEEVDFRTPAQAAGANYGWRCYEGHKTYNTTNCNSTYVTPIFDYKHNGAGGYSITGGFVYRGAIAALQGYYICSDYVTANAWKIKSNGSGGWNVYQQTGVPGSIVGYGEDENAELYAVSLVGKVYAVGVSGSAINPLSNAGSSAMAEIIGNTNNKINIYPTFITNSTVTLELKEVFKSVSLYDMQGHKVMTQSLAAVPGNVVLRFPSLTAGMYILEVEGNKSIKQRLYISK